MIHIHLINQFLVTRTNKRKDEWGGVYENRMRLALEIVKGIREKCGRNFIIIYRLSIMKKLTYFLISLTSITNILSQNSVIKGKVIDATNNETIPFANVMRSVSSA